MYQNLKKARLQYTKGSTQWPNDSDDHNDNNDNNQVQWPMTMDANQRKYLPAPLPAPAAPPSKKKRFLFF